MPIYEYYSPDTHTIYQFFARSPELKDEVPRCPAGADLRMEKKISNFSYLRGATEHSDSDNDLNFEDPQIAGAMAEMERDMARMDPDNPDPRAMGTMMEKMAQLTGEKLPADMQEMVGRLKAGEDLESIEEKFGDLMDETDIGPDTSETDRASALKNHIQALRRKQQPQRDPKLYELSDWI